MYIYIYAARCVCGREEESQVRIDALTAQLEVNPKP